VGVEGCSVGVAEGTNVACAVGVQLGSGVNGWFVGASTGALVGLDVMIREQRLGRRGSTSPRPFGLNWSVFFVRSK
jgi:hypothetical protein